MLGHVSQGLTVNTLANEVDMKGAAMSFCADILYRSPTLLTVEEMRDWLRGVLLQLIQENAPTDLVKKWPLVILNCEELETVSSFPRRYLCEDSIICLPASFDSVICLLRGGSRWRFFSF